MNQNGYLEVIIGPMFSGKTTRILELYRQYSHIVPTYVINHSTDNRYGETTHVFTHNKDSIPCTSVTKLSEFKFNEDQKMSCVILINEGQFFEDLEEYVEKWVNEHKASVYVCGLDGDFQRKKIGSIMDIIPIADSVTKLSSVCKNCNGMNKAIFTHRITKETAQVVIGSDNYIPVCRKCYNILNS